MEASPRVRLLPYTGLEDHNQSRRINVSTNPTVHQYEGDNALWCYIGGHTYELSRCKYCNRKQHMIDLPLPNKTRASRSND